MIDVTLTRTEAEVLRFPNHPPLVTRADAPDGIRYTFESGFALAVLAAIAQLMAFGHMHPLEVPHFKAVGEKLADALLTEIELNEFDGPEM